MRILICGDRNWKDRTMIHHTLLRRYSDIGVIIEGEAKGADSIARMLSSEMGMCVEAFPAKWGVYGRAAGPIRNQAMLDAGPDEVWAFHDNLQESKGTLDMIKRAVKKGVRVLHFSHECPEGRPICDVKSVLPSSSAKARGKKNS